MRNRPGNLLREDSPEQGLRDQYVLERSPLLRVTILFGILVVPLLAVSAKLIHLQVTHAEDYIVGFEPRVTESFEPIETTDGRILMDGTILAQDVESFRLKMHFRWLEEPADEVWLRRKARSQLSSEHRRDRERIEAEQKQILEKRRRMWSRLATSLGVQEDELKQRRETVQSRVERIVRLVEERRDQRNAEAEVAAGKQNPVGLESDSWWGGGWKTVRKELTTSPKRRLLEPIEVTEEFDYHIIAEDIPGDRIAELATRRDLFPGIELELVTRRDYPRGPFAAHIVGDRRPAAVEKIENLTGSASAGNDSTLQPGDRIGRSGVERTFDDRIRGRRGLQRIVRNAEGEIILRETVRHAEPGSDIELALVEPLQRHAESLLDASLGSPPLLHHRGVNDRTENSESYKISKPKPGVPHGGCIVAMNVHTGEILCAAAAPRFDLRVMVDFDQKLWETLQSDPRSPMFPRVTSMALPPGSIFKTLTAIAALEEGQLNPEAMFHCRGYLHRPDQYRCLIYRRYGSSHQDVNLTDAICQSCNVYFYTVGEHLGPSPIVKWAHQLGFGRPTGIDLPGEASGSVPNPNSADPIQLATFTKSGAAETRSRSSWRMGDTRSLAIGQSTLTTTPLQIVRLMAAVANGGKLVTPHVTKKIINQTTGEESFPQDSSEPVQTIKINPRTLHFVRAGLEQVVTRGTGRKYVKLDEVAIAGKTGTAEVGGVRTDHAWFAGYVPANAPQIAIVAVLEHGGGGGSKAGPLARQVIDKMLELKLIVPGSKD